jgi:predicted permease
VAWQAVLATVLPVFGLVALGFVFGRFHRVDLATLTDVVVYMAGPALVFSSLAHGTLVTSDALTVMAGTCVIVLGVGVAMRAVAAVGGLRPGPLYLPAMFMNSGNMLLPLGLFAFGEEGLRHGVIIFVTVAVLQSTVGVTIASGRPAPAEMFRLPYVHAAVAALAVRVAGVILPEVAARPIAMVGDMAVPLMLIALGLRLRTLAPGSWRAAGFVVVMRIAGGYAMAWSFVTIVGLEGTARSCLLLGSVMPSAVINFIFAEKFASEPGDVATAVVASTLVSVVTTPLVLAFGL